MSVTTRLSAVGLFAASLAGLADDAAITLRQGPTANVTSVAVRPNNKQAMAVEVKNTSGDKKTFTVLLEADGLGTLSKTTVELKNDESKPITFPPPPAPKVEPKKDAPAPKAEATKPEAKKEETLEPPPGVELKRTTLGEGKGFAFRVRVTDAAGKELAKRDFKIDIALPNTLVDVTKIELEGRKGIRDLKITTDAKTSPLIAEADPVRVALMFPPQLSLAPNPLRAGTYQRELKPNAKDVTLYASEINLVPKADGFVRFHLDVDGYARAFTYAPQVRQGDTATPELITTPAVRLLPVDGSPFSAKLVREIRSNEFGAERSFTPVFFVRPSAATKFLAEVENESPRADLLLKLDRSRAGTYRQADEIENVGSPRDVRVWLNLAGPEGQLEVADTVRDRVVSFDTSSIRGKYELRAALGTDDKKEFIAQIVVDDTPAEPGDILFGAFEKQHVRGTPLPVSVTATDVETTPITKVDFVMGKPGPDGVLSPDLPKFEAILVKERWVAQLPMPAEKKGPMEVTAVVQNAVGLESTKTVRIELVDKKLVGKIAVRVERGGRPQPDVPVLLRDAKNEEKAAGRTNAKGEYVFEELPPGFYKVASAKPDAGQGSRGEVRVEVQVDKVTKVALPLMRPQ